MIKTKHDVTIEIDDKSFKITVQDLNKEMKVKLDESRKEKASQFEAIDDKNFALAEMQEEHSLNAQLLEADSLDEMKKVEVIFEQKELNKKITNCKKEIQDLQLKTQTMNEALESHFEEAFDLCVKGENATSLKKKIDETGISYAVVFQEIKKLIAGSVEKK